MDRRLPVRPSLDQLKHQARDLLRSIRAHDPSAVAELGTYHPRQVEPASAKLADAQLALARSYQASSWPRLVLACRLVDAIWRDDAETVREIVVRHPRLLHEDALVRRDSNWGPPMTYAANLGRDRIITMLRELRERTGDATDRGTWRATVSSSRLVTARRSRVPLPSLWRCVVTCSLLMLSSCGPSIRPGPTLPALERPDATRADTTAIASLARELSSDTLRGRGPWTPENERVANRLAAELGRLGAQPVFGDRLLVPFVAPTRPRDTVFNVVGVLPGRDGERTGELVGITAHFDHLGVGTPDASGDSIYNGFLDAALPIAMVLDVARRYAQSPGERPLIVIYFNLEEQALLGSKALVERPDAGLLLDRLQLLIGVDAGSPAGEATQWQLMGALPAHPGARTADSLARSRGWTTTATAPRAISDVFPFSQHGVPILFPIPGAQWQGYSDAERAEAMRRFDHYHQPSDEWRAEFPLVGTAHFADWLWEIVRAATNARESLRP